MPATDRNATGLMRRRLYDPAQSEVQARLRGIAAVLEEWLQMAPAPSEADTDLCLTAGPDGSCIPAVPQSQAA